MTEVEAAAAIEAFLAAQQIEEATRRATITPHVRRVYPYAKSLNARKLQWAQERAAARQGNMLIHPQTYCGAPVTTEDWDRRTAVSNSHAASADASVCPVCLTAARNEAQA